MNTGDERTNFADKRNLPQQRLKDTFFDYLIDSLLDVTKRIWGSERGVFGSASLTGGTDVVSIGTLPVELLDGDGYVMTLAGADGTNLNLENALGITYYVGCRHCLVPSGVERNPRNDVINYDVWVDAIGETGTPNTVAEVAGQLQINVNNVFEAGVDHSGRLVTVWMNRARTTDESVAIERNLVVSYVAGNNFVTTSGLLGQASGSASSYVFDYTVAAQGATIRRNTNLQTTLPYAFIGTATGAGAGGTPTTSTSGQVDITDGINSTLDEAYNNSGTTKKIYVDDRAVELVTGASGSGDNQRSMLRLTATGRTENMGFLLEMILEDSKAIPVAVLEPLRDGSNLLAIEACTCAGTTINCTRGGVDLQNLGLRIRPDTHVALISGADVPADDGLYLIYAVTSTGLILRDLDGSLVSFTATAGNVTVLHPNFVFANSIPNPLVGTGVTDMWSGLLITLRSGEKYNRYLRISPEDGGWIIIFDHGKSSPSVYPTDITPRELLVINPDNIAQVHKWPFAFKRGVIVNGGDVTGGAGQESWYWRDGVRIWNAGGGVEDRDPMFPLVVDYGFPEQIPTFHSLPVFAVDALGGVMRGHHFRDDFMYQSSSWTGPSVAAGMPSHYDTYLVGAGTIRARDGQNAQKYGHGCVELTTGATISDVAELFGPYALNVDPDYGFRWTFRARLKMSQLTAPVRIGLVSGGNPRYYFQWNTGTLKWDFIYWNGTLTGVATLAGATVDEYQWFEIYISSQTAFYTIERKDHAASSYDSGSVSLGPFTLPGSVDLYHADAWIQTPDAAAKSCQLDYWEWFDQEILFGRLGNSHNLLHP